MFFVDSNHDLITQVQLRMTQVEVTPLVVTDPAFDGAWLLHPFPILNAPDLSQEIFHPVSVSNK